ncbi:MAG: hypothetical protein ACI39F_09020 [Acutalibacteraceae bacterium]
MKVKADDFSKALNDILVNYNNEVKQVLKRNVDKSMAKLVKTSKDKAPERTGKFKKHITSKVTNATATGYTKTWYVSGGQHRLTHLLEKGHQLRQGGRKVGNTKGSFFLSRSIDDVIPEFIKNIEKDLKQ